jgi:hypothetical protein
VQAPKEGRGMMGRPKISRCFMKDPSKVRLKFLREYLDKPFFDTTRAKIFLPEIGFDSSSIKM